MTENQEYKSLPAWVYSDPDFFKIESELLFKKTWQLVCHQSNIPNPGDYFTFSFLTERVFAIRGQDGTIRAFHNVCRHRASKLLEGNGNCRRIKCPYHAWGYDLEGTLKNVPFERDFVNFDKADYGLKLVEMEIWEGFVFVRIQGEGPKVSDLMDPFAKDISAYRFSELEPLGRVTLRPRDANWKSILDNYVDALHIEVAHDGLTGLFGNTYDMQVERDVHKLWGDIVPSNKETLSVRLYKKYLPKECRRRWEYFRLWPNLAFDCYPDQVDFMQMIPISPGKTMIREISYGLPDQCREMKVCRYLNWRINRQVNAEDTVLIKNVEEGMASSSYTQGPFAKKEGCLIDSAQKIRELIPLAAEPHKPGKEKMSRLLEGVLSG